MGMAGWRSVTVPAVAAIPALRRRGRVRGGGRDIFLVRDLVYSVDRDRRLLDGHRGRPARVLGRVLVDNLSDDRARPFRRLDSRVLSSERGQSGGPHRRRVVRFGALGVPLLVQELVENVV